MRNDIRPRPTRRVGGLTCVVVLVVAGCGSTPTADRLPATASLGRPTAPAATVSGAMPSASWPAGTTIPPPDSRDPGDGPAPPGHRSAPGATSTSPDVRRPRTAERVDNVDRAVIGTTTTPDAPPASPTTMPAVPAVTPPRPTTTVTSPPPPPPSPSSSAPPPTATPTSAPVAPSAPAAAPPATAAPATDAVSIANEHRAAAGLPPLVEDPALVDAARSHSLDQAAMQSMTHTGSNGSNAGDRIASAGFAASTWGENVAAGYGSTTAVMDGWMSSHGHRENILGTAFTAIGVASARAGDGTLYWTMVLAG